MCLLTNDLELREAVLLFQMHDFWWSKQTMRWKDFLTNASFSTAALWNTGFDATGAGQAEAVPKQYRLWYILSGVTVKVTGTSLVSGPN